MELFETFFLRNRPFCSLLSSAGVGGGGGGEEGLKKHRRQNSDHISQSEQKKMDFFSGGSPKGARFHREMSSLKADFFFSKMLVLVPP